MKPNALGMLGFILLLGAPIRLQGRSYANGKPDVGGSGAFALAIASPSGDARIRNPTYPKMFVSLLNFQLHPLQSLIHLLKHLEGCHPKLAHLGIHLLYGHFCHEIIG
jgi:hypothetical protein